MRKGLKPLWNGTRLADWTALITHSAMANALSDTCAVSWHIQIERPETNYQLWLPDKAPFPTHFLCQTEREGMDAGTCQTQDSLCINVPPAPSLDSNCPPCRCLPMWESRTVAPWSWGKLNLRRREPCGCGWFIYKLADRSHRGPTVGFRGNGL